MIKTVAAILIAIVLFFLFFFLRLDTTPLFTRGTSEKQTEACPYKSWQDVPELKRCKITQGNKVSACDPSEYFTVDPDPCLNKETCKEVKIKMDSDSGNLNINKIVIEGMCKSSPQQESTASIPNLGDASCILWRTVDGQKIQESCDAKDYFGIKVDPDPTKNTDICEMSYEITGKGKIEILGKCLPNSMDFKPFESLLNQKSDCAIKVYSLSELASGKEKLPVNIKLRLCEQYELYAPHIYVEGLVDDYDYILAAPKDMLSIKNAILDEHLNLLDEFRKHKADPSDDIVITDYFEPTSEEDETYDEKTGKYYFYSEIRPVQKKIGSITLTTRNIKRMDQNNIPIILEHCLTDMVGEEPSEDYTARIHMQNDKTHVHLDVEIIPGSNQTSDPFDRLEQMIRGASIEFVK